MKKTFRLLFAAAALLGFAACADVPELPYPLPDNGNGGGGDVTSGSLPFTSASLNDFTVQTIEGLDWSLGSTYAKATGYKDNKTTATKTWLVSPAINTSKTGDEGITVSFDYVLRYVKSSTDLKGWHKVLVSKDYSGDATTATWTDLGFEGYEKSNNTAWEFYAATPMVLPEEFQNEEKVFIAFYFQCDGTNSTTWEMKNFCVAEGGATPPTPPLPVGVTSVTVAQFNAASVSNDTWYQLTGTASGIKDGDVYGNFDLTDETGKVYVYGLLSEKGGAKQQFQALVAATGLANGDKITIHATRGEYNGKVEAMNAYFVSLDEKGEGGGTGGGDATAQGDGTKANPYNIAAVRAAGNPGKTAWVKGYIVGTIKADSKTYDDAVFGTADASNTNFLLADDASCTNAGKCIPVQLPTNLRDALSLQKNPGNLGQMVYLNGSLEKYFGQPGLKNVTEYSFDGTGGGDDGGGDDQGDGIFSADFTKGACGFTAFFTPIDGIDLAYVWAQSASYGWKGSAYKGGNIVAESWLVSPAIDLGAATTATMNVNQAVNYTYGNAPADYLSICVSTDYTGDPATTTWNVLSVPSWPEGNSWDFSDSGDISLTPYCGQKIVIGFRYTSTEATAPTWEIKNCIVK